MLGGHKQRGDLHVVAEVGILDGVAEADLDGGGLDVGSVAGGAEQDAGGGMVAEVLTNTREVVNDGDADLSEMVGGANAGEQEEVGVRRWRRC